MELPAEGAVGGVQFHVLSPRCQCFSQRTRSRGAHVGGEVCSVGGLAPVRVRGRLVMVPEWVAFTGYTKAQLTAHEHFPVPRFLRVERERATPMQLQGVSRFKQAGPVPRCVVPDQSKFAIRDVLERLFEAECFLGRLAYFFKPTRLELSGSTRPCEPHMRTRKYVGISVPCFGSAGRKALLSIFWSV